MTIDMEATIVNTCIALTKDYHSLAYYTHVVPIIGSVVLSVFLWRHSDGNLQSRIFAYFVAGFATWLAGDLVTWVTESYYLVPFIWSLFDYINILFFLGGLYFLAVIAEDQDVHWVHKMLGFALTIPALYFVFTGTAVGTFDQATCGDSLGNESLNLYKNVVESLVLLGIVALMVRGFFFQASRTVRMRVLVVGSALLMFFLTFAVTDLISVATNVYEIGLYGLMIMPVFLAMIVFSIVTYETVSSNVVGAQVLVGSMIALISAELFFVQTRTNLILVLLTLAIAGAFGRMLVTSVRREIQHREEIERLAKTLDETNGRQETLIHFIGHEVKGFLTKDSAAFASLLDGDFAPLPDAVRPFVTQALTESRNGADSVANILKASNLKKGTVTYDKKAFNMKELVAAAVDKARVMAGQKGLSLNFDPAPGDYTVLGDAPQITDHVLRNLIENAVNYTPTGSVTVSLVREGGKVIFSVKDSGVGITAEDKARLFTEGGHGKDSQKVNAHSTGYGLYIAKQIVDAHQGTIRAESEGAGKGSTFIAEFPVGEAPAPAPAT